ncbi:MAG TPA: hypothetical protein DDZ68_12830 [Parvularcula sp.]|nr:hypothetical protein [Parvularcula sp.]
MAKSINATVLDQALNYIKNNCTKVVLCSANPTTFTEANATFKLAEVTVGSGDFTLANGDVSGRKITRAAKTGVTVSTAGTATHEAWLDMTNSAILKVTDGFSQAISGTVDIGACKYEINNPS